MGFASCNSAVVEKTQPYLMFGRQRFRGFKFNTKSAIQFQVSW
jgi:hypothetical protein